MVLNIFFCKAERIDNMVKEYSGVLNEANLAKFDDVIEKHKDSSGALMPILNEAQKIFGCIPLEIQLKISEAINVSVAEVYGVITFYSHFSIEPKGKYIIGVCMGTACYVKNAQLILEELEKEADCPSGKTSADGKFTIEATRCIGACGLAPVFTINRDVYGRVTVEQISEIIAKYR